MASTNTVKAFDKIQNLQWYSEHFLENSPYDLFKQIIDDKIEKKQPKSAIKKINKVILFYNDETFETFTN